MDIHHRAATCLRDRLVPYVSSFVQVDVLVTTAGGIEEDLIKCLGPVYVGDFNMSGKELYEKGVNRWGLEGEIKWLFFLFLSPI